MSGTVTGMILSKTDILSEKTDRPLEVSEAMEIGGLERYEVLEIKELLIRIDNRIQGSIETIK